MEHGMTDHDFGWQWEKSRRIVVGLCHVLQHAKQIPAEGAPGQANLRGDLHEALWNATKLLCQPIEVHYGDSPRWSPDLVDYLIDHPEDCESTLRILESEDYRDGYYDKQSDQSG